MLGDLAELGRCLGKRFPKVKKTAGGWGQEMKGNGDSLSWESRVGCELALQIFNVGHDGEKSRV